MIETGANVDVKLPNSEWTLLHILFRHYPHSNLIELVRLLIQKGVEINTKRSPDDGWTILHILCTSYPHDNLVDLFRLLNDNDVDLNAKSSNGLNALHLILTFRCEHPNLLDLIRLLIENGVDVALPLSHPCGRSLSPFHFLFRNPPVHYSYDYLKLTWLNYLLPMDGQSFIPFVANTTTQT